MSEKKARIMNAKDSTANWNSANPTLLDGELGFEVKSNREISMKVGDGATDWKNLKSAYCTPSEVDEKVGKAEKSLQGQINNIVLSSSGTGDVTIEVIQARTDASGTTHSNLKERLDLADNGIATLKKGLSTKAENGDVTNISKTVSTLSQNVTNLTQTKANSADVYTKKEVDSKTVVDSSLNKDSNNAISNKAVSMMLQGVNSEIAGLNKVKADASTTVTHTADTAVGNSTQPVYIAPDGTVKACTCKLGKDVPAGAKFTDTTYSAATTSKDGLMSSADKAKLDGIATGATNVIVDDAISYSSAHAVSNRAISNHVTKGLANKVDIVEGKGLSTNDFTAAYKTKLDGIATGANHIIVDDKFSETSGNPISNRAVTNNIQKKLSDFAATDVEIKDNISHIKSDLNTKVDKVTGKGLSTNDFTNDNLTKLAGIATGANKTTVDTGLDKASTNPVQNKAVYAKFQGVDSEISGINSVLNSTASEITTIVNEYSAKNLLSLKTTVSKVNASGLNVSFIDGGGIRVYGTKTTSANGDLYFVPTAKTTLKPNTKYTLTVANSASNAITARMHLNADGKTVYAIAEKNKTSISFTTPTGSDIYVEVYAVSVTDNNPIDITVYPMLRYASIKDDTFVPYAMTNRELTEKVADTGWVKFTTTESYIDSANSDLKYRRCGKVVSFRCKMKFAKAIESKYLFTFWGGTLPYSDVIPEWVTDDNLNIVASTLTYDRTRWVRICSSNKTNNSVGIQIETNGAPLSADSSIEFDITYLL